MRCPLVNDMSREQIERGLDVAETLGVDQPIFSLSRRAVDLVEKPPEVLARCLAIPRLVSPANDDIQTGPTLLAKLIAPPSEECVELLELDAHGQLCSLESVCGEGTNVFLESVEIHPAFGKNPVDKRTRAAQQLIWRFHCC